MNRSRLGRRLIGAAAILTIVVPITVDGIFFAKGHMANPLWLPHAKLHCAMSFFAAISLGVSALAILKTHPMLDRANAALATFLATAFWMSLVLAGLLPGTSYGFLNDPNLTTIQPPVVLGLPIEINVAIALCCIALGWLGFFLLVQTIESHSPTTR